MGRLSPTERKALGELYYLSLAHEATRHIGAYERRGYEPARALAAVLERAETREAQDLCRVYGRAYLAGEEGLALDLLGSALRHDAKPSGLYLAGSP